MMFEDDVKILLYLEQLKKEGIFIWSEDDKLKYRCETGKLPSDVLQNLKAGKEKILDYLKRTEESKISLTPIQYAYYIGQQSGCELGAVNAHYYIEYEVEQLDVEKMKSAVNKVIQDNDALRMVITSDGGAIILEHCPYYEITVYQETFELERIKVRKEWSQKQYEIGTWPMYHFHIGKNADGKDLFHVSFDCIILDAWSAKLMMEKIFAIYDGKNVKKPELTFAQYSKKKKDGKDEKAELYWSNMVENMPKSPQLSMKQKVHDVKKITFLRVEYAFNVEKTQQLYANAKQYHFTPAAVLCTIFMQALSEFSEEKNVAVNLTLFNRQPVHKDVNEILGEFTNIGVAKYEYLKDETLYNCVKKMQKQFWKLVEFRNYDGTNILKKIANGQLGKAVMPVVFTCMLGGENTAQSADFQEVYSLSQTPQVIIDHHVRDDLGYLKVSWDYVEEIFERDTLKQVFDRYVDLIKQAIDIADWNQIRRKDGE